MLRGTVAEAEDRAGAEAIASALEGVTEVMNAIEVQGAALAEKPPKPSVPIPPDGPNKLPKPPDCGAVAIKVLPPDLAETLGARASSIKSIELSDILDWGI